MKKRILSISIIAICLSILAYGTVAYFSAEKIAHNVITSGGIDIEIIEKTKDESDVLIDFPEGGLQGVMPGASVSKVVSVKNCGSSKAYIRTKAEKEILSSDGTPLDTSVMTFSVDSEKWTKQGDWYYYNAPVEPNDSTEVLFDTVNFSSQMGNAYQNCKAKLSVSAQAVQVANNGTAVLEATGWPTEVSE